MRGCRNGIGALESGTGSDYGDELPSKCRQELASKAPVVRHSINKWYIIERRMVK
jgi:hypothetical protein